MHWSLQGCCHSLLWALLHTGKNTPLDPEELDFLDSIAEAEALRQREASQHERQELDEFRQVGADCLQI